MRADSDNKSLSENDGENVTPEVPSVAQPVVQEEQPAEQVKQPVAAEKRDEEKPKEEAANEVAQQSPPAVEVSPDAPKPAPRSQDEDGKEKVEENQQEESRKNNLSEEEKKKYALTPCVDTWAVLSFYFLYIYICMYVRMYAQRGHAECFSFSLRM